MTRKNWINELRKKMQMLPYRVQALTEWLEYKIDVSRMLGPLQSTQLSERVWINVFVTTNIKLANVFWKDDVPPGL